MTQELNTFLMETLADFKAQDITLIDVTEKSSITDAMIICTATSSRHVASIADNLIAAGKQSGFESFGEEGIAVADWVVVDFGQAMVHIMQSDARELYQLEKLWA